MATGSFEATHERIMENGKKRFLERGYDGTGLRELCKAADITTGAFYRHFADKEALFFALVEDTTSGLKHLLRVCLEQSYERTAECLDGFYKEHYQHDIPILLNYIYSHFDSFELLAACDYKKWFHQFVHELAMIETEYARRVAAAMRLKLPFPEEILLTVHQSFYIGLFEVVVHNIPEEHMEDLVTLITQYYTACWSSAAKKCETAIYQNGSLHVTEGCRKEATDVCEEHSLFTDYLIEKGIPIEQAQKDVCKMESSISAESFLALKQAVRSEMEHKSAAGN